MRIDAARGDARPARARGPDAEVHLHGADVPEPGRRDDVAGAPAPARPARRRARAARARGQPVRAAALRGRSAAAALRARPRRVRHLPRHVLEDPRRRACGSAGPPRRGRCSRSSTSASRARTSARRRSRQHFVIEYFAQRNWRDLLGAAARALPAPPRHDARRARRASPARGRLDAARAAGCSSGRRCPTTSTRRTCSRARCASTSRSCPGRAAYLDGRGGSSMRLNFSGVGEDDLREGVRADRQGRQRAGAAVLDAHRRRARAARRAQRPVAPTTDAPGARVAAAAPARRRRAMSRVAVLAGGQSLERQVSLRSGARVRDALERLGHDVIAIDVGPDLVERLDGRAAGRRVRRAPRPRRRGRHRAGDPRARRRALHRVGPVRLHALHGQGAREARAPRRRAADARLLRVQPDRVRVARRRARAAGDRGAARLPGRRQAGGAGLRARDPLRADRRRGARPRSSPRSPTTRRCCSSATSPGASSPSRCSTGPTGPEALPVVEAIPRGGDHYDFEARYEIGRTDFVCPAELDDGDDAARAGRSRSTPTGCSAATASPAST